MLAKVAELDEQHGLAVAGGGEQYVERHRQRGKLLARERIELLLDPGTAFLELSPLAGWGSDFTVGASVVTGIGVVEGVECLDVPAFSVQYHPEAAAGPHDSAYLFDRFVDLMAETNAKVGS